MSGNMQTSNVRPEVEVILYAVAQELDGRCRDERLRSLSMRRSVLVVVLLTLSGKQVVVHSTVSLLHLTVLGALAVATPSSSAVHFAHAAPLCRLFAAFNATATTATVQHAVATALVTCRTAWSCTPSTTAVGFAQST